MSRAPLGGGALLAALSSAAVIDALVLSLFTTGGQPGGRGRARRCRLPFLLARASFPGKSLVETLVDLPIVLPPSVAGLALLLFLGRRGVFGEALADAGLNIPFTTLAVIIAQVFVAMPFFVRSARAGLVGIDREVEDAARVDGASENGVLRWVSLPLAAPALAAGLVMSWARALGEFGATIMFAGSIAAHHPDAAATRLRGVPVRRPGGINCSRRRSDPRRGRRAAGSSWPALDPRPRCPRR